MCCVWRRIVIGGEFAVIAYEVRLFENDYWISRNKFLFIGQDGVFFFDLK